MAYDANDPADKKIVADLIKAALAEQAEEHEQDIQGLKTKNSELIKANKDLKAGKGDPQEVEKLEASIEELQGKLRNSEKTTKKLNEKLEETTKALETESAVAKNLLVDNGLTAELTKVKVAEQFLPGVKALLSGKVELKDVDGKRIAVVGDKPLSEFVSAWSQGDEGKHYVSAANNGGGNALGSPKQGGGQNVKSITRAELNATPLEQHAALFRSGVTIVDA